MQERLSLSRETLVDDAFHVQDLLNAATYRMRRHSSRPRVKMLAARPDGRRGQFSLEEGEEGPPSRRERGRGRSEGDPLLVRGCGGEVGVGFRSSSLTASSMTAGSLLRGEDLVRSSVDSSRCLGRGRHYNPFDDDEDGNDGKYGDDAMVAAAAAAVAANNTSSNNGHDGGRRRAAAGDGVDATTTSDLSPLLPLRRLMLDDSFDSYFGSGGIEAAAGVPSASIEWGGGGRTTLRGWRRHGGRPQASAAHLSASVPVWGDGGGGGGHGGTREVSTQSRQQGGGEEKEEGGERVGVGGGGGDERSGSGQPDGVGDCGGSAAAAAAMDVLREVERMHVSWFEWGGGRRRGEGEVVRL